MKIVADKNIPFVEKAFRDFGNVVAVPGRDITSSEIKDADILLVRTVTRVNRDLLANSQVQFVGTATIGYDHIDVSYLKSKNIAFASAAGCNANSVAEYIVAGLLVLAERYDLDLSKLSIGVIGVGNVGTKVASKAKTLGMDVLLNDPPKVRKLTKSVKSVSNENNENIKEYLPLNEVLASADIVSMHVPLTYEGEDATYRMAGTGFFNRMKSGSFFINTSRGPVADTHSLINALYHGKLTSAIIDVWEDEPAISTTLLDCVDIGTPHIAGYSRDGKANATQLLYEAASIHFDMQTTWQPGDLPSPRVPVITVPENGNNTQALLGNVIKKAYDIQRDDRALRMMQTLPAAERPAFFDRLRNEYPVRREFHSMTVCINEQHKHIAPIVQSLGFKLKVEQRTQSTKKRSIHNE